MIGELPIDIKSGSKQLVLNTLLKLISSSQSQV